MTEELQVFPAEAELGDLFKPIAFASQLQSFSDETTTELAVAVALQALATNRNQIDLHFLQTILVSTGWNKNDDVFGVVQAWLARKTPEDKPFNFEHNETDIIGHITDNYVVNAEGGVIEDSTNVDDLPEKFHIVTGAVLYKNWQDEKLQERIDTIIEEIAKGEWFVSMEALFSGFDFALIPESGGVEKVLARTQETAFLTKYLRCYGGDGKWKGYRVGRLLKNITFSGKGLVRKPANPESVILSDTVPFKGVTAELNEFHMENVDMPDETAKVSQLEAQVASLTKERDEAKAKVDETLKAKLDERVKELEATVIATEKKVADLTSELAQATQVREEAVKNAEESAKALTEAQAELKKVADAQAKATRVAALEKVGVVADEALATVEKFAGLSDELFGEIVKMAAAKVVTKTVVTPDPEIVLEDIVVATEDEGNPNVPEVDPTEEEAKVIAGLGSFLMENFMTKSRRRPTNHETVTK